MSVCIYSCSSARKCGDGAQVGSDRSDIAVRAGHQAIRAHEELQARGVEFTDAPHMIHRHADGTEEWMAFSKDAEARPLAIMAQVKLAA